VTFFRVGGVVEEPGAACPPLNGLGFEVVVFALGFALVVAPFVAEVASMPMALGAAAAAAAFEVVGFVAAGFPGVVSVSIAFGAAAAAFEVVGFVAAGFPGVASVSIALGAAAAAFEFVGFVAIGFGVVAPAFGAVAFEGTEFGPAVLDLVGLEVAVSIALELISLELVVIVVFEVVAFGVVPCKTFLRKAAALLPIDGLLLEGGTVQAAGFGVAVGAGAVALEPVAMSLEGGWEKPNWKPARLSF